MSLARRHHHLGAVFLALSLFAQAEVADAAFTVPAGHPRLFLDAAGVTALRNRCLSVAPYTTAYQSLKSRVDGWTTPSTNRYIIGAQIHALVLVSLVENGNATYLAKTDTWIRNLFETQGAVNLAVAGDGGAIWGSGDIIIGMATALDWLYPYLSAATRTRYGTNLRDFQEAVITQQGGMTRDSSRADYSNQFYFFDGMFAISGIALYNEGIDNSRALTYLNTFDANVRQNMLPVVNQVGGANGGWHEGLGYVDRGMTSFTMQLEAWRVGAGEDLFPQASGLRNLSKWVLYATQPDGNVANVGDVSNWPVKLTSDGARRAAILANRYRDGYAQSLANQVSPTDWTYTAPYLLWYDATVTAVNKSTLPLDHYADGIGWVSMRAGWAASDVFALFTSGNYYFGHQHYDQNSFQIFRSTPLAIDNGTYNIGTPAYKTATRFHNTILVGDPGSASSTDDGAAGQTGANPTRFLADPESSTADKGDIQRFESAPQYTLVVGDASKAYSSSRVTSYIRKFLYVKPDYFVVLDRVVVPNTTYPIRWQLQLEAAPTITGRDLTLTNGAGQLQVRSLLPADAALSSSVVFSGTTEYGGGNYRVEAVPATRRTQEVFLTVLRAPSGTPQMTDARLIQSSSGALLGAQFANSVTLMSATTAGALETYTIVASSTTSHIISDLVPNTSYSVRRDGVLLTTVTASGSGVIGFTSPGGGQFTIQTGTQTTPAPRPPSGVLIKP